MLLRRGRRQGLAGSTFPYCLLCSLSSWNRPSGPFWSSSLLGASRRCCFSCLCLVGSFHLRPRYFGGVAANSVCHDCVDGPVLTSLEFCLTVVCFYGGVTSLSAATSSGKCLIELTQHFCLVNDFFRSCAVGPVGPVSRSPENLICGVLKSSLVHFFT